MQSTEIEKLIQDAMPDARVVVRGEDGVHFEALIVTQQFKGLGRLKRHQLVYAALGSAVGGEIHALSMQTLTPEEWAGQESSSG